jgi:hypothetical protein
LRWFASGGLPGLSSPPIAIRVYVGRFIAVVLATLDPNTLKAFSRCCASLLLKSCLTLSAVKRLSHLL